MTISKTAAVVLGAGQSKRYGSENKLWQPFEGQPLIRHTLSKLMPIDLGEVIIVLQPNCRTGQAIASDFNVHVVENDQYRDGMSCSIRCGLEALSSDMDSAFIILADMPRVEATTYKALLAARERNPHAEAYVPVLDKRRGNPVLFARPAFRHLTQLVGDAGAKSILNDGTLRVSEVICSDPGIFFDVDMNHSSTAPDEQ